MDVAGAAQEPEATDAVPAERRSFEAAMAKFLKCSAQELWPYERYVSEGSPYATQHDEKGAQFERVMLVMDKEESDYRTYNYERVFASAEARATDRARALTVMKTLEARALRLLYVCCSRAQRGLSLTFFAADGDHPGKRRGERDFAVKRNLYARSVSWMAIEERLPDPYETRAERQAPAVSSGSYGWEL
jgi:hypothetical protein